MGILHTSVARFNKAYAHAHGKESLSSMNLCDPLSLQDFTARFGDVLGMVAFTSRMFEMYRLGVTDNDQLVGKRTSGQAALETGRHLLKHASHLPRLLAVAALSPAMASFTCSDRDRNHYGVDLGDGTKGDAYTLAYGDMSGDPVTNEGVRNKYKGGIVRRLFFENPNGLEKWVGDHRAEIDTKLGTGTADELLEMNRTNK